MEKYTVDRFEGDFAVLENRETLETKNVLKKELPKKIKVSDILCYENNVYKILENETEIKKKELEDRFSKLLKKN